ncbi:MAG: hypothetical protein E6929_05510 [Clostridium sp.]|nr:hypothetical protein [Clostridium sp.]
MNMCNADWSKIIKIKIYIFIKMLQRIMVYFKRNILVLCLVVLFCVFSIFVGVTIDATNFTWLIEIKGYLITFFLLFKIYWILCSTFKTRLCLSSREEFYIFSFFSNDIMIKYKVFTMLIKNIVINFLLIGIYFYVTHDEVNYLGVVLLITISIFSELLNSCLYQKNNLKKKIMMIYSVGTIFIVFLILLMCSRLIDLKYLNIYMYFDMSDIFLWSLLLIFILASAFILKKLISEYNKESLMFYGNIKSGLNNVYRKIFLGMDVSLDAQVMSNSIFKRKESKFINGFYKLGYKCITFKNLNSILSINIVQKFYSYIDILVISILISFFQEKNIVLILVVFLIMQLSLKINGFFIEDIKNREVNKCLPLSSTDFLKGYLFTPLILNFFSSIYIILLLNLKGEYNFIVNLLILMLLVSIFIGITLLKQYGAICNVLKIKSHISFYIEFSISLLALYVIFQGTVWGMILSLCVTILIIIVYLVKYKGKMDIYTLGE